MVLDRVYIKKLIQTSLNFNYANRIVELYTEFKDPKQKIDFLKDMFHCKVIDSKKSIDSEHLYYIMLTNIILENLS